LGHGTIPGSNSICFLPDGSIFLGTNFGGIHQVSGGDEFVCETSVTGTQQAIDAWRVLADGRVAAVATSGDFMRGVYLSGADGCGFSVVAGTEGVLPSGLADDGAFFMVSGQRESCAGCAEEGVVMRGDGSGVEVLAVGAKATGVVVGAGERVAVFSGGASAEVVRFVGDEAVRVEVALASGETLVPLGVGPRSGGVDVYLIKRGETGDRIFVSADFGATLVEVGFVVGRVFGFAAGGGDVWLQSPQVGVLKRVGATFEEVAGSPYGGCLTWNGRLWACGVPWQDGFALGVSDDRGATFSAVMPFYDGIVRARRCEGTTATCDEELAFLRGYYGFSDPTVVEPGPEVVEGVEPGPEPDAADGAESVADAADGDGEVVGNDAGDAAGDAAPVPKRDGGCAGGSVVWWAIAGLPLAWIRRRRLVG
jgi:Synergist-CTERM protein sorting domain-containing protein